MISSGSVALWCQNNSERRESQFEAHFNYWRIVGDRAFRGSADVIPRDFLEAGILLDSPSSVDHVSLFIPLKSSAIEIEDCSPYFRHAAIAEGVFNQPLIANPVVPILPCVELRRPSGEPFASVFSFVMGHSGRGGTQLVWEEAGEGTIITIPRAALTRVTTCLCKDSAAYFRLRIYLPKENPFIKPVPVPDWWLHSSYDEIEYVDFRFNEARTLPDCIQQRMQLEWHSDEAPLSLVAFLTAIPGKSQLSTLNAASYKMRLLERPTWNAYVPGGIPEGMMVYHWKKVKADPPEKDWEVVAINDLTTFVRLETRHSLVINRLLFLALALMIGILGSLLAPWIPFPTPRAHTANCEMKQTTSASVGKISGETVTLSGECREQ